MSDCETDILEIPMCMASIDPCMYDPICNDSAHRAQEVSPVNRSPHSSDSESDHGDSCQKPKDFRTDNLTWCDCENCVVMPTNIEWLCCQEVPKITEMMEEEELDLTCITQHEGFIVNCTNRHVILTSIYEFLEDYGPTDDNDPPHN